MRHTAQAALIVWLAHNLTGCAEASATPRGDAGQAFDDSGLGNESDGGMDGDEDGGDGDVAAEACFAGLKAPATGFISIQAFSVEELGLTLMRAREPGERSAVGETFPYDLLRVSLSSAEEDTCVTKKSALSYEFGHHNWNEKWSARTARARYVVRELRSFDDPATPWIDSLEVRSLEDDSLLMGPFALKEAGCRSLPYDLNPCSLRTRIDKPPADW